jgi:hypothetical protein
MMMMIKGKERIYIPHFPHIYDLVFLLASTLESNLLLSKPSITRLKNIITNLSHSHILPEIRINLS